MVSICTLAALRGFLDIASYPSTAIIVLKMRRFLSKFKPHDRRNDVDGTGNGHLNSILTQKQTHLMILPSNKYSIIENKKASISVHISSSFHFLSLTNQHFSSGS